MVILLPIVMLAAQGVQNGNAPPPPVYYPVAPPPPPPPPAPTLEQRTRYLNQWAIITSKDYPKAARKAGITGRVHYRVEVSVKGRVDKCTILISSGNAELDGRTCERLIQRARMAPATDMAGKPTRGTYDGNVIWQMPD